MARILVIRFAACPAADRAGSELEHLLKALAPRHAVDLLAVRDGDQPFFERLHRARVLRVPLGAGGADERAQSFGRAVRRQVEGGEYDLVYLGSTEFAGAVIEKLVAPARLVLAPDPQQGEPSVEEPWPGRAGLAPELAPEVSPDLVIVRSEAAARALRVGGRAVAARSAPSPSQSPFGPVMVEVVVPGVDVDRFDWEEAPPGPPRILHAGRVARGRGLSRLAAAVARLPSETRLAIAGAAPAEERARLEAIAPGRIEWLGRVEPEEMPALYAGTICVVVPAVPDERQGPPLALLEAMACRRVALAPRVPMTIDLLDDGNAGLLFDLPPADAERGVASLAAVLGRVLDDEPLRARLAAVAHARVRERWTAAAQRRRLRELIAGLAVSGVSRPTPPPAPAADATARDREPAPPPDPVTRSEP